MSMLLADGLEDPVEVYGAPARAMACGNRGLARRGCRYDEPVSRDPETPVVLSRIYTRTGDDGTAALGDTVAAQRTDLKLAFADPRTVEAYRYRPPYPAEVFDLLEELITGRPRHVLDIGAGDGALARPLAGRVDRVDAVDVSPAMLAAGARQPGGDQPNLHWILGAAETAELAGPYALVTAGASLHWMDWQQTLTRLAAVTTEHAFLAIVDHGVQAAPWQDAVREVIVRHSPSSSRCL
jgi:SAM-dependent methyltransferase